MATVLSISVSFLHVVHTPECNPMVLSLRHCSLLIDNLPEWESLVPPELNRFYQIVSIKYFISIHGGTMKWVSECRYLGVYFISIRTFKCSCDNAKAKFFRAFNAKFSLVCQVGCAASEDVAFFYENVVYLFVS